MSWPRVMTFMPGRSGNSSIEEDVANGISCHDDGVVADLPHDMRAFRGVLIEERVHTQRWAIHLKVDFPPKGCRDKFDELDRGFWHCLLLEFQSMLRVALDTDSELLRDTV